MPKKKYVWAVLYSVLLVAYTLYVALDTFVISKVYMTVPPTRDPVSVGQASPQPSGAGDAPDTSGTSSAGPVVTDDTYADENIQIRLSQYRREDTTIYVADVTLSSASYLRTAFAQNAYGRNVTQTTSEMAESHSAILAVNGDYYGSQEQGYVLRNGTLYRDTPAPDQEDLAIYGDGSFGIFMEEEVSAAQLLEQGVEQVLSFGPALVVDGELAVTQEEEVGKARAGNPRTAIAILDDLHYLIVVADGRTEESRGLSLYQLAGFLQELGAKTAYNLDGGGSSTMVFNGKIVNQPTSNGRDIEERSVSDIVYIGYQ